MKHYAEIGVFIAAFAVSTTAGIAAFLRSGKELTKISLITAALNSGLLGLAIALLWYQKFQDNIYTLMGICVISGLTGAAGFDTILSAIQHGTFKVDFTSKEDKRDSKNEEVDTKK